MATKSESLQATTHEVLIWHLKRWNIRLRLARTVVWLPRGLLVGIFFGLIVAFISRLQPWLLPEEIFRNAMIAVGVTGILTVLLVWLWPRPATRSAQDFDLRFDLKERISTALEISSGMLSAPAIIREHQLEDARVSANKVNPAEAIPLRIRWTEVVLVTLALLAMMAAIFIEPPFAKEVSDAREQEAKAAEQRQNLEDIRDQIASDPALSDQQQDEVTQPIEEAINDLEQDNLSDSEIMAELAQAEQELREMASDGQTAAERQAFQQAGRDISESEAGEDLGEALQSNDLNRAAEETNDLAESAASLEQSEREQLADQLEAAANALEETDPEIAEALREAAEALREGDMERAEEALQRASEMLQEQATQNEEQAEAAEQAADQVEQSRQELVESGQQSGEQTGQQSQQQSQQGSSQQSSQSSSGQQPGEQSSGQQSDQTSSGQPSEDQSGEQPSGQQAGSGPGQESQQEGNQSGEGSGGEGTGESSGTEGQESSGSQQSGSQTQSEQAGGSGAGDTGSTSGSEDPQGGEYQPGNVDNTPGDDSMREFEPVFSPQRIGDDDSSGPDMSLSGQTSDDEGDPITERNPNEDFQGESYVPYNQVFQQYQGEAQRALESDYIPISMRDIVRAYFTALEPE